MEQEIKLSLKDRKVLYELDKNSRQSNSEIAKKSRLNKNTTNYKIKGFEKQGIIKGYYPVIDTSKMGYFSFRVYLKFFNTTKEKEKEIVDWLKESEKVGVLARIEAIYDLCIMCWVKNVYEFDDFWLEFKKKYRKYFWNERVDVFTKVYHFKRKYLLDEAKYEEFELIGERKSSEYDKLDFEILKLLVKNARIPLIEMSERLKVPPRTLAFRIRSLEKKKIIQGYRANIVTQKIGYEYYKINFILDSYDKYDELVHFSQNHKNIIYIDRTVSSLDFEIDIEIKSRQELLGLINEIKEKFNVRDAEILVFKEYYKLELLPH